MKRSTSILAGLFVLAMVSGCSATGPTAQPYTATIATAADIDAGSNAQRALIWTIDGRPVPLTFGDHEVAAGTLSFSVMPVQGGSIAKTRSFGLDARNRGVHIAEMTVDLEPGQQLLVAAVVRRHRTYIGRGDGMEPLEAWQTSIVPYVVSDVL